MSTLVSGYLVWLGWLVCGWCVAGVVGGGAEAYVDRAMRDSEGGEEGRVGEEERHEVEENLQ